MIDTARQLGCPQCGYVFTPEKVRACPVCHRARCRCKETTAGVPLVLQDTLDPRGVLGYCPSCGQRTLLFPDVHLAVATARAGIKARDKAAHRSGHRGRTTLTCGYCRAGNPLGRFIEGEQYK